MIRCGDCGSSFANAVAGADCAICGGMMKEAETLPAPPATMNGAARAMPTNQNHQISVTPEMPTHDWWRVGLAVGLGIVAWTLVIIGAYAHGKKSEQKSQPSVSVVGRPHDPPPPPAPDGRCMLDVPTRGYSYQLASASSHENALAYRASVAGQLADLGIPGESFILHKGSYYVVMAGDFSTKPSPAMLESAKQMLGQGGYIRDMNTFCSLGVIGADADHCVCLDD